MHRLLCGMLSDDSRISQSAYVAYRCQLAAVDPISVQMQLPSLVPLVDDIQWLTSPPSEKQLTLYYRLLSILWFIIRLMPQKNFTFKDNNNCNTIPAVMSLILKVILPRYMSLVKKLLVMNHSSTNIINTSTSITINNNNNSNNSSSSSKIESNPAATVVNIVENLMRLFVNFMLQLPLLLQQCSSNDPSSLSKNDQGELMMMMMLFSLLEKHKDILLSLADDIMTTLPVESKNLKSLVLNFQKDSNIVTSQQHQHHTFISKTNLIRQFNPIASLDTLQPIFGPVDMMLFLKSMQSIQQQQQQQSPLQRQKPIVIEDQEVPIVESLFNSSQIQQSMQLLSEKLSCSANLSSSLIIEEDLCEILLCQMESISDELAKQILSLLVTCLYINPSPSHCHVVLPVYLKCLRSKNLRLTALQMTSDFSPYMLGLENYWSDYIDTLIRIGKPAEIALQDCTFIAQYCTKNYNSNSNNSNYY